MPPIIKTVHVPRPLPHQAPILLDPARQKVVVAGRRWGKSVLGLDACILGHGPNRLYKGALEGAQIRWIAPTYPLSVPMWESLKQATYECWAHKDEVSRTITLPGGGAVSVKSADNPDSLRGVGSDGVVMDEAAFAVQAAWENGVRPTLADRQGWVIFISSPNGFNWFHDLFQNAKVTSGWAAWQRPTSDNPRILPEEIAVARRDTVDFRFRQEWLAEFTAPGVGMFRREWWNVADAPPPLSSLRMIRAWDFASTETKEGNDPDWTAGALLAIDQEARVWVLDVRRTRSTPDDRERFVLNTAASDGRGVPVYLPVDPGSAGVDVADHYVKRVLAGYCVHAHKESGDKAHRAEPLAAQAERRNVWIVRAPWNRDWMNETDMFPTSGPDVHDDQVDAASLSYRMLSGYGGPMLSLPANTARDEALGGMRPSPAGSRTANDHFIRQGGDGLWT